MEERVEERVEELGARALRNFGGVPAAGNGRQATGAGVEGWFRKRATSQLSD